MACAIVAHAPGAYAQSNTVSTIAGTGFPGPTGDGGPATSAQLNGPINVSMTADGGFLITDQFNARVRRVSPGGIITLVAGTFSGFGGDNGPATSAQLSGGINAAVETADGSILIADSNNNRIRRVAPNGTITTVAGGGSPTSGNGDGGPATNAILAFPADVAPQPDGGYLIADNDNHRIRRVDPNGDISTVAGSFQGFGGDGIAATDAQLNGPSGVAGTADGGFLIADTDNNRIRRVAPNGDINTMAGGGTPSSGIGDGGPATAASLNGPVRVATRADGTMLIADRLNNRVRRVAPDGTIDTIAGTGATADNGDGQAGTSTNLNNPFGAVFNPEGDVLIAETLAHRVRLLDAAGPPPPPPAPATLTLDPASANRRPGDDNAVTATARNSDGSPAANRAIRWEVTGPNETAGAATTDAQGTVRISWEGVREGIDTLTAYVDINQNSTNEPSEPTGRATVTWALPAPVQGRVYNLEPVSGIVKIRIVRRGKGVHGAGSSGFQTLAEAQQVNFDTIVDVRKGRVRMTTASSRQAGDVQKGEFYGGVYTTTQPRTGARPVTELRLSESLICRTSRRGKLTASRARTRRLWGNARGRFRTRGRRSAATVRGTVWLTKDTCATTTTTVREGVVTVRDFAKRRNVTVRAGRTYTARARARRR